MKIKTSELMKDILMHGGWRISVSDDGKRLYACLDGKPGDIHLKAEDEGFAVDVTDDLDVVASLWVTYSELEGD